MFYEEPLTGRDLPPKTLCLTFDDGPGHDTIDLARFLFEEGVSATFFVIGEHAVSSVAALEALVENGHSIGNHTYSHVGLVDLLKRGGDPAEELIKTDRIIGQWGGDRARLFRPPYGSWAEGGNGVGSSRILAGRLNARPELAACVGPVLWNISADDFAFWERGGSAADCCAAYVEAIERADHGIVLMHDSSEKISAQVNNRALETCIELVPKLKSRGYRISSIWDVPAIRDAVAA